MVIYSKYIARTILTVKKIYFSACFGNKCFSHTGLCQRISKNETARNRYVWNSGPDNRGNRREPAPQAVPEKNFRTREKRNITDVCWRIRREKKRAIGEYIAVSKTGQGTLGEIETHSSVRY